MEYYIKILKVIFSLMTFATTTYTFYNNMRITNVTHCEYLQSFFVHLLSLLLSASYIVDFYFTLYLY